MTDTHFRLKESQIENLYLFFDKDESLVIIDTSRTSENVVCIEKDDVQDFLRALTLLYPEQQIVD